MEIRKEMIKSNDTGSKSSLSNGFIAFLSGKFEEAEKNFRDAYKKERDNLSAIQNLTITLLKQGKLTEALNVVNSKLKENREKGMDTVEMEGLFLLKFLAMIRGGTVVKAFEMLHNHLGSEIMICQLDRGLASPRRAVHRGRSQFQHFRLIIELMQGEPFPYFKRGIQSYLSQILHGTLEKEKISSTTRSFLLSYRALILLSLGKMDKARESIAAALNVKETYVSLLSRGKVNYQLGRLSEAYGDFIKAKNTTDENAEALINMGAVLAKVGDYQRGLDLVKQGLKKVSGSYAGWRNRALILLRAREWEKAKNTISILSRMRKDRPEIWLNLGIAYMGLKKPKKALEAFNKYKERETEHKDEEWVSMLMSLTKKLGG